MQPNSCSDTGKADPDPTPRSLLPGIFGGRLPVKITVRRLGLDRCPRRIIPKGGTGRSETWRAVEEALGNTTSETTFKWIRKLESLTVCAN